MYVPDFPGLDPLIVIILATAFSTICLISIVYRSYNFINKWPDYGSRLKNIAHHVFFSVNEYALYIVLFHIVLLVAIAINQLLYINHHSKISNDVLYYLRVNRPDFHNYNVIRNSQFYNSYSTAILRKLYVSKNQVPTSTPSRRPTFRPSTRVPTVRSIIPTFQPTTQAPSMRTRSPSLSIVPLTASPSLSTETTSSNDVLSFVYHTNGWSDVLVEDTMYAICKADYKLKLELASCTDTAYTKSFIPFFYNSDCSIKNGYNFSTIKRNFGLEYYSAFMSDHTMYDNTASDVLISYYKFGDCDSYTGGDLETIINGTIPKGSGLSIAYVAPKYYDGDIISQTTNARDLNLYAMLFVFILLCFLVRGFIIPLVTYFCVWFSMVNAASILNYCKYAHTSVFNSTGMIVLSTTGIAWVALYGSSWRSFVDLPGKCSVVCRCPSFT